MSRDAFIRGALADTGKGYPALFQTGDGLVVGELYTVDWDQAGAGLDELETYYGPGDPRNEYERVEMLITDGATGQQVQAWTYVYPPEMYSQFLPILSGDWTGVSRRRMV